jgi:aldehyde dehydrogenase (NAD+)
VIEISTLFIGGEHLPAHSRASIGHHEAATSKPLGTAPQADALDVDAAVAAAKSAFPDWSHTDPAVRAAILHRFADELTARGADTSTLVSRENGMPITLSRSANVVVPTTLYRYYADLARSRSEEEVRPSVKGNTLVRREPMGVVAAIAPWNYPQALTAFKVAPALAAGNTVVLKPSPETALDAFVLAEAAIAAGLPPGVLNIVSGGRETGEYLVSHPDVAKVSFTGSTPVGRAIGEACGRLIRPVSLELGGKSAGIVLDDADVDVVASTIYRTSFLNNGQTCYMSSRVLVPDSRYDEVVEAISATVRAFRVGDPLDESTHIGPLVSEAHRDRVLGYVNAAQSSGARVVAGGGVPNGLNEGSFVEPTVFADVENDAAIAREEVFGPVISVTRYGSVDDAVRIANDSEYGLAGTVWSKDEDRAVDVARRVETGSVGINGYFLDLEAPFGGVKASGVGRELGPEALDEYTRTKSVYRFRLDATKAPA